MMINKFLYVSFLSISLLYVGLLIADEQRTPHIEEQAQAASEVKNSDYIPTFEFNVTRGEGLKRNENSSLADPDSTLYQSCNRQKFD
jgi:hypothetical protein